MEVFDACSIHTAQQIIAWAKKAPNTKVRITADNVAICPPRYTSHLTMSQFLKVPVITVESLDDFEGDELRNELFKHEISILRNATKVLGMDLKLFSTDAMSTKCPGKTIEVRKQSLHLSAPHSKVKSKDAYRSWAFSSFKDEWILHEFAEYQRRQQDNAFKVKAHEAIRKKDHNKSIWFGTNFDLPVGRLFASEYSELQKLPGWLRPVNQQENMLSSLDFPVSGMNNPQIYFKETGFRTPAHQENNNFCFVNVNIGPGDTEWFATPFQSWGLLNELCIQKKIGLINGSWWPDSNELIALGIPVYRFTQKPDDLVFVNIGCIHWVQANGVCNSVAWNVGPYTADQFRAAAATYIALKYEYNKIQHYISVVPMKRLIWNIAKRDGTVKHVKSLELRMLIRIGLTKSLFELQSPITKAKSVNTSINISYSEEYKIDRNVLCSNCEEEVFGIIFGSQKSQSKNKIQSYCYSCAVQKDTSLQDFKGYLEYKLDELVSIFDSF